MGTIKLQEIEQFLSDEKELLTDLALDVANADTDYKLAKAKASYSTQLARVSAIADTIKLINERVTSN